MSKEQHNCQIEAQLFVETRNGVVPVGNPERWVSTPGSQFTQVVDLDSVRVAAAGLTIYRFSMRFTHVDTSITLPTEVEEEQAIPDDGSWLYGNAVGDGLIDPPGSAF